MIIKKIKKILKNPIKTSFNFYKNNFGYSKDLQKINNKVSNVKIYLNIAPWKRPLIKEFYSKEYPIFLPLSCNLKRNHKKIKKIKNLEFIIWGYSETDKHLKYIEKYNFKLRRIEDGFLRSVGLGAAHTKPLSLVRDSKNLYFNKDETELKNILNNYNFKGTPDLLHRAKKCIELIKKYSLTKYNFEDEDIDMNEVYGPKEKKRILVIGQVESDASIKYGMKKKMNNNELIFAARTNNPDAEIIYRPHPDVLNGYRKKESDPKKVENIAKIFTKNIPFIKCLETIDEVYTMTSLTGFEALMRGIKVTVFGQPFYAGWGLTNDMSKMPERKRKLSIEELFAGAYILYPDYFDYFTNKKVEIEDVIDYFIDFKKSKNRNKKNDL